MRFLEFHSDMNNLSQVLKLKHVYIFWSIIVELWVACEILQIHKCGRLKTTIIMYSEYFMLERKCRLEKQ